MFSICHGNHNGYSTEYCVKQLYYNAIVMEKFAWCQFSGVNILFPQLTANSEIHSRAQKGPYGKTKHKSMFAG